MISKFSYKIFLLRVEDCVILLIGAERSCAFFETRDIYILCIFYYVSVITNFPKETCVYRSVHIILTTISSTMWEEENSVF